MSRVGLNPITIENGVSVEVTKGGVLGGQHVVVKGPKGQLEHDIRPGIEVTMKDNQLIFERKGNSKQLRSYHGLYRSLVNNMIEGVTKGFIKELEVVGVGYRASLKGNDLELTLGLNHPVLVPAPEGIEFKVVESVYISVSGINKELVGNVAAGIRAIKKPEPYKGKGIKYKNEQIRRKAGKTAA